ncbi:tail fibers protein [Aeromonas phage BUCT696]|uniref:tail fibers protein n=1 Tax=Aeromonas phage BUCT696 TaxID=2911664 RepID=UPI0024AD26A1|nr:tail fibers protein [Aeromonas phage BUCT696]UKH48828.1 tail fibers protein [Aeromonas phage BUCT696]
MTERPTLGRIWAAGGSKKDPGQEKYAMGWVGEIPTYEVLNYLQNRVDTGMLAMAERGVPEWGPDVKYPARAVAWDNADGKVYISKVANPSTTLSPKNNASQWEKSAIQYSIAGHIAAEEKFDNHIGRVDNPHQVTAEQAGTYTKGQIDQKVGEVDTSISSHSSRADNPHEVHADQIGAVPTSGGTYTGPVVFEQPVKINPYAGNQEIYADSDFIGMRYSNDVSFGLRKTDGRAVIRTPSGDNALLNEVEYVEKKREVEPEYAVPTPDLQIDGLSDIHIKMGVGFSDMVRASAAQFVDKSGAVRTAAIGDPRHTIKGLTLDGNLKEYLRVDAQGNIAGFPAGTVSIAGVWQASTADTVLYEDNSGKPDKIFVQPDGDVVWQIRDSGGQDRAYIAGRILPGQLFVVTVTFDSQSVKTYLNGIAGQFGDISLVPTSNYTNIYIGSMTTRDSVWYMQNFKIWAKILTPEQITTL